MRSRLVRERNKVDPVSWGPPLEMTLWAPPASAYTLSHLMHQCKHTYTHKGNDLLTKREEHKGCGLATVLLKSGT